MEIGWIEVLGIVAGVCTTAAVIPQVFKAWKTKKVEDVSLGMFSILTLGVALWTIYGVLKNDLPIILFNGISVALNLSMIYLRIRHSKKANS